MFENRKETIKKEAQVKALGLKIKAVDPERNIIEGYASTFGGEPDAYGDVIVQGAYTKTIKENGDRIKYLMNHNWDLIVGKVVEAKEDAHGLFIKAKISETENGKNLMTLVKDGVIDRMSIGYIPIKWDFDESGICYLREIKLLEVSAVGIPANEHAEITGAKNLTPDRFKSKEGEGSDGANPEESKKTTDNSQQKSENNTKVTCKCGAEAAQDDNNLPSGEGEKSNSGDDITMAEAFTQMQKDVLQLTSAVSDLVAAVKSPISQAGVGAEKGKDTEGSGQNGESGQTSQQKDEQRVADEARRKAAIKKEIENLKKSVSLT